MTGHAHPIPDVTERRSPTEPAARPRWLIPTLIAVPLVGALLAFGLVSPNALLYIGLFGGMMLMHMGGHGHGGHGGGDTSRGHSLHGDGTDDAEDLSRRSSGAQPNESGSGAGLDERARANATTSETDDDDQHSSHRSEEHTSELQSPA